MTSSWFHAEPLMEYCVILNYGRWESKRLDALTIKVISIWVSGCIYETNLYHCAWQLVVLTSLHCENFYKKLVKNYLSDQGRSPPNSTPSERVPKHVWKGIICWGQLKIVTIYHADTFYVMFWLALNAKRATVIFLRGTGWLQNPRIKILD